MTVDPGFWRERRVFLTGHTGFKGAWLALWLHAMGAHVTGFSLGVPTRPSLYELARVGEGAVQSIHGDVCEFPALCAALASTRPEVVVHMAAQSLVRRAYAQPRETYAVNVMGTVNLLDAVRVAEGVRAVVIVTSDKSYLNREWPWGYREHEPMGGNDPYSSSKGCAELVTEAYRRSFFSAPGSAQVASARAGNVIGGGDWSEDRLVADLMRGAMAGETVRVRHPDSVRPWQHVLNPLSGYLALAQALCSPAEHEGAAEEFARAFNFGPAEEDAVAVGTLVGRISELWPGGLEWEAQMPRSDGSPDGSHRSGRGAPHEARYLKLDSSLARAHLDWRPRWGLQEGLEATVRWYRGLLEGEDMRALTIAQIEAFQHAAMPGKNTHSPKRTAQTRPEVAR